MILLTKEKAEIIGFLCAEGCHHNYICKYWNYDKRRKNSYFRIKRHEGIDFGNNNPLLLDRFLCLLRKCYHYERRVTGVPDARRIVIVKMSVFKDLLSFTDYGCLKWRVPKIIINTRNKRIKSAFLRGYYEGDGVRPDLNKNRNLILRARFNSKNLVGLKQVAKLLKDLNIKSNLHFSSKRKKECELCLYGKNARTFINLTKPLKCRNKYLAELAETG
jgi:hypothetical protein